MNLAQLKNGEEGIIIKVKGRGAFRKRISEMGFIPGKKVRVVKNAPLKDPIEYNILGYEVSLRRTEARLVDIITEEEALKMEPKPDNGFNGTMRDNLMEAVVREKSRTINVALVGNPNCGKTTIFNHASRSREHTGNYSGVTVDSKAARFYQNGYTFNVIDLPGTYSLSEYSPEELFVRKYIFDETPDVVINVVDASNLERNLYLTTQLIDMDVRMVIALNMYDELKKQKARFAHDELARMMAIPIVPTVGSKGTGITELFDRVIELYENNQTASRIGQINYGEQVENAIRLLQDKINENRSLSDRICARFYALKLLEKDKSAEVSLSYWPNYDEIKALADEQIEKLESRLQDETDNLITDARYGFIAGALKETYTSGIDKHKSSDLIDAILTHHLFGFPLFFFILFLMFYSTFEVGKYPMEWLEMSVGWFSDVMDRLLPENALKDLLVNGIIGGVGSVIVFLPNILILFFFISLMEDTGYMARVAFIMDKPMHKIGLHGRSFIPLIMGFGCNVPAIMATRTIENRYNRLVTILINPFMSCSARLPVYILIIGIFFPNKPGLVLFLIYLVGVFLAAIMAILFKRFLFRKEEIPFVMELPPYRIPVMRNTMRHMWFKAAQYLKKMGGVILVASLVIWFLGHYPRAEKHTAAVDARMAEVEMQLEEALDNSLPATEVVNLKANLLRMEAERKVIQQENSFIGMIGKGMEPIIRPLGFDWRMGVSLLTGVAAKEVVVSTLGVIFRADHQNPEASLQEQIRNARYTDGPRKGEKLFDPVVAIAFLMFILIYFPCVAVIGAIRKESGSWLWAAFTVFYTTGLAWLIAFAVNQIGHLIF